MLSHIEIYSNFLKIMAWPVSYIAPFLFNNSFSKDEVVQAAGLAAETSCWN